MAWAARPGTEERTRSSLIQWVVPRRCPGVRLIYSAEEPNRQRVGTWALGEGQVRSRRTLRDDGRTPVVRWDWTRGAPARAT